MPQFHTIKEVKVLFDAGSLVACVAEQFEHLETISYVMAFSLKGGNKVYLRTTREPNVACQIRNLDTIAKYAREIGFRSFTVFL